jgi:hypothetical protein
MRELRALDRRRGTTVADTLDRALRQAVHGERELLLEVAEGVLVTCGGRFRAGLYIDARRAEIPERRSHGERERRSS